MSFTKLSILLVAALSLSACNKFRSIDHDAGSREFISFDQQKQKLAREQKSAEQVRSAEAALAAGSIEAAIVSINDAVNINPSNERAKFYQELLRIPVSMRGFFKRVTPFVGMLGNANQQKYSSQLADLKNSDLKAFLVAGEEDIKTEKDMSAYTAHIRESFEMFKKYLVDNKAQLFPEPKAPEAPVKSEDDYVANEKGTHGGGDVGVDHSENEMDEIPTNSVTSCDHAAVPASVFEVVQCMMSEVASIRMGQSDFDSMNALLAHSEEHLNSALHALTQEF